MKRFFSSMLAVLMLVQGSAALAADTSAGSNVNVEYQINVDYESDAVGTLPVGGGAANSVRESKLAVAIQDNGNKYLQYNTLTKDGYYHEYPDKSVRKKAVLEFSILCENQGNADLAVFVYNNTGIENEVVHVDRNQQLCAPDGSAIKGLALGKFYHVSVAIDCDTGYMDIWVNHKKAASDIAMREMNGRGEFSDLKEINKVRFHMYNIKDGTLPIRGLDNVRLYAGQKPLFMLEDDMAASGDSTTQGNVGSQVSTGSGYVASQEAMEAYMKGTVALYVNANKIAIDGKSAPLDEENPNVKAVVTNGRTLVPARFVSEALKADVKWDETTQGITISKDETEIKMTIGSTKLDVNGKLSEMETAPVLVEGRTMVPVRFIAEALNKKLTYDKSGLIVIADRENYFNFLTDINVFRKLADVLVYREPSGAELVQMIKTNYPNNGHPRLFADADKFAELRQKIANDDLYANWFAGVKKTADRLISQMPLEYDIYDGIRLQNICRAVKTRVEQLGFTYQITQDEKYAERCLEEVLYVCEYPDWNPSHFLDPAEMMFAVALGYDWLYNYMDETERATVRNALVEMGLNQIMEDYEDVPGRKRTYFWAQSLNADNWNVVCNSGALHAAMAIGDEEEEIASKIFDYGLEHIKQAIDLYGPDGSWYEGPGYWMYTTNYYVDLMSSLDTVFGDTFGYMDAPGVAQTGYFMTGITGPDGAFNYHDANAIFENPTTLFFLADKLGDANLNQVRVDQMKQRNTAGEFRDIVWYNANLVPDEVNLDKDYYWRDTEAVTMRSSWNDNTAIFAGFHAGAVNVYHGHMDIGSFVIDAYGTRYAMDLGTEDYNILDSVWNLYRYRAEGHNTLVINPDETGGQLLSAATVMDRYESGESSAYAIVDMTDAYSDYATSAKRGMMMTNNRSLILIQDEVKGDKPMDIWWFMHTDKEIELSSDGQSARIKGDTRDAVVQVLGDVGGSFSVMDATPMETSPVNDEQNKNEGIRKLAYHVEGAKELTLPIAVSFAIDGMEPDPDIYPELKKLDDWTLTETGSSELPKLTSLKINGNPVPDFNADNVNFKYAVDEIGGSVIAEASSVDGVVEIKYPEEIPGNIVVTVSSKADSKIKNYYVVSVDYAILQTAPVANKLEIKSFEASDVPQPENAPANTLDGDINTRWSALGDPTITYDLGSEKTLSYIGLAIYQENDNRQQYLDILVSNDGKNFTKIRSTASTGATTEMEYFMIPPTKARYVQIMGHGTSVGEWNSITEFAAYGE